MEGKGCYDLPDIRVFIRALRIHSTRCPTFVRERATTPAGAGLTTLARDLSLGLRATGRAGQEWYILLILRLYHSFTKLRVVKGEIYAEIGKQAAEEEVSAALSNFITPLSNAGR